MSKQLAISSAFATFAMAAMALALTPSQGAFGPNDTLITVQVEAPQLNSVALDLPDTRFFR